MGDINELMLLGAIAGAEMAMRDVGLTIQPGSGVAAAEEYWRSTSVETTTSAPTAALAQPVAVAAMSLAAPAGESL
jgi:alanine-glyoxylate transaminase/serine-glyoxylate transaminase/serine-pyruvate transaminase